jgi:hypothetical protein
MKCITVDNMKTTPLMTMMMRKMAQTTPTVHKITNIFKISIFLLTPITSLQIKTNPAVTQAPAAKAPVQTPILHKFPNSLQTSP